MEPDVLTSHQWDDTYKEDVRKEEGAESSQLEPK